MGYMFRPRLGHHQGIFLTRAWWWPRRGRNMSPMWIQQLK